MLLVFSQIHKLFNGIIHPKLKLETLATFSSLHNRSGVTWRERIPYNVHTLEADSSHVSKCWEKEETGGKK